MRSFGLGRVVGDGNARRDEIVERKDSISFERASRRSRSSASEEFVFVVFSGGSGDLDFVVLVVFVVVEGVRMEDSYLASFVTRASGVDVLYFVLNSSQRSALF